MNLNEDFIIALADSFDPLYQIPQRTCRRREIKLTRLTPVNCTETLICMSNRINSRTQIKVGKAQTFPFISLAALCDFLLFDTTRAISCF